MIRARSFASQAESATTRSMGRDRATEEQDDLEWDTEYAQQLDDAKCRAADAEIDRRKDERASR